LLSLKVRCKWQRKLKGIKMVLEESNMIIKIEEIFKILPHRYPFLLVDAIVELEEGKRIVGIKNFTINEPFFQGHFPNHPIVPAVLLIEAMAQTAGILAYKSEPERAKEKYFYFMGIDKAKFRKPVTPGHRVKMELELLRRRSPTWKFKGKAYIDNDLVAEAELLAMVAEEKIE
jgi:3-hydroxyacyl-[acyl-carrier-protein] dehydratase